MKKPEVVHELEIKFGNEYGPEEEQAAIDVIRTGAPSCGAKVKEFEDAFAAYCGTRYALTCTSATTGLTLSGIAAGVGADTEVITTPLSWIATAMAYTALGAEVKFCDVDPNTLNMDPDTLEALITERTKAIVPVHLAGNCCEMDRIMEIADRHGIVVIEDCAHAPGAEYNGKRAGNLGNMGVFSFHQQKNMATLGEGGMVTTNDKKLFDAVLSYRSLCCRIYGGSDKYLPIDEVKHPMNKAYWMLQFDDIGFNFRMTDIQAAVGLEQLKKVDGFNRKRREVAAKLDHALAGVPTVRTPINEDHCLPTRHLYPIQLAENHPLGKRDFMWEMYYTHGIKVWNHYMPMHLTEPYLERGHTAGECPVAEKAHDCFVTLPIHPRLTDEAVLYMADCVKDLSLSAEETA